jgi:hypothetical protein
MLKFNYASRAGVSLPQAAFNSLSLFRALFREGGKA